MEFDVVVVGSGAAGLTAAVTAAQAGLKVLVVEKTAWFGGSTALSGGGLWIPNTRMAKAAGFDDSIEEARTFLKGRVGETLRTDQVDSFLEAGPKMVDFMHRSTAVEFALSPYTPDWGPDLPGAKLDGRLLGPKVFDGKHLGPLLGKLRRPVREFNAPGGMMIDLSDLPYVTNMKSPKSMLYMGRLVRRHLWDRARGNRGTRLTMGNALAGRLLMSARGYGVELWADAPAESLVRNGDAITGIVIRHEGHSKTIGVRRGVVLAAGGFSASSAMRQKHIPYASQHVSICAEGATGDGIALAETAGGGMDAPNIVNAGWSVISTNVRADGTTAWYAHLLDMAKPGCIAVDKTGRRFANEASEEFVEVMHKAGAVPAWLVCDSRVIKAYGMGLVVAGGMGIKKLKASGYLTEAPDLRSLALAIDVDPNGLLATAATMNEYARTGRDVEFHKGESVVDTMIGDMKHTPNPCLGTVQDGPFYAIKIFPGDGTTTLGLRVDAHARVVDADEKPIEGLYAAGLDMNSVWRGRPPGHGANIGLAMTFGYIAGRELAGRPNS